MREEPELSSQRGQKIVFFSFALKPALGSIQPPIYWVLRGISPGLKRSVREDDYSPPSSAKDKHATYVSMV